MLNNDIKRTADNLVECYNCGEEVPDDQLFHSASKFNPSNKEFCSLSCQLAFAQSQLDAFDWIEYYKQIVAGVGYRPFVPPHFSRLQRFGGDLTLEQYLWGQRPVTQDVNKRQKTEDGDNEDEMEF